MELLQPTQPYHFQLSLKRLMDMPKSAAYRVEPGPAYVRAVDQGGQTGLVRVAQAGDAIAVTTEGDLDGERVAGQVRRAFSLDLDLSAFLAHMDSADSVLAGVARRYLGARPIAPFSLWESLAVAIVAQQVNITFAYSLKQALIRLGDRSYGELWAFPGPEAVARLEYAQLRAEKFTTKKAEYIVDLARAIVEGRLDLEALVALPYDAALRELVKLRGVGRWTAECLLMDAGAPDAFPAGDIGIRNAVQRFYGLDHQPTEAEVREIGRPWAPYSSLACFYLWLGLLDRTPSAGG